VRLNEFRKPGEAPGVAEAIGEHTSETLDPFYLPHTPSER
jgi:hypothetical protein